jgi:hypothetical protein
MLLQECVEFHLICHNDMVHRLTPVLQKETVHKSEHLVH